MTASDLILLVTSAIGCVAIVWASVMIGSAVHELSRVTRELIAALNKEPPDYTR